MLRFSALVIILFINTCVFSQVTFPDNGAANKQHLYTAFTNAIIHVDYENTITNGILLIRDGKIAEAGTNVKIPTDAVIINLKGYHIYPSFIDLYSKYGVPQVVKAKNTQGPQINTSLKGAYAWNEALKPEKDAISVFAHQSKEAEDYLRNGFGIVLTSSKDGIVSGTGALVSLGNGKENADILKDKAAAFYSFKKGGSQQDYPESLMGSIALLRQTYYDAKWYKENNGKDLEYNLSLEAFNTNQTLPSIFEVSNKLNALRADKIGDEFNVKYIIKGSGDEYQRVYDIQATFCKYIIPLNFPELPDVEDPFDAEAIGLGTLKHWEMAPANPRFLQENGISFAFTSADLKERKSFLPNLRKAVKYGLSEANALKALTANPAQFLGVADKCGSLQKGMKANFFISDENIFNDNAQIVQHWINGNANAFTDFTASDYSGIYALKLNTNTKGFQLRLNAEQQSYKATIQLKDTIKTPINVVIKGKLISLSFKPDSLNEYRLSGAFTDTLNNAWGRLENANGEVGSFELLFVSKAPAEPKKEKEKETLPEIGEIYYPFMSYGKSEKKENIINRFKNRLDAILIKDATVWTNEAEGILKECDVYIVEGKIVRIAENIDAPKGAFAKVINAKGKHLTAGIIDEHSHIAISEGVNEAGKTSSAEVRIGDVVNSEDINIYRQLAGGVTTAQLLHGSANPIGGQSALIKLRWGLSPEELKYDKADGFIKFALGENVKQSNWGDMQTVRFPQSRMGVEQVYYDFFTRAKEYESKWKAYNDSKDKNKVAPRRDLELEALVEILDKKRFITCHSYVQSEINMLMHVADSMGFKVNTFTHILEGYKVADKMKAHGVAASTFADWWAYKVEVTDAIPYNAALLSKMGIVTSVNSDDAEMGRRLNQEAAKAIKYGGLTEEEALKLVTLNPAKMLHIDDKVGSIKVGKSGDVVLWSNNPLSVYAKVEKTIIDGIIYFDTEEDVKLREAIASERARIITKMIAEKKKGTKTIKPQPKKQKLYECDTMEEGGDNE